MAEPEDVQKLDSLSKNKPLQLLKFVNEIQPGWIIDTSDNFSEDLSLFNHQWASACHGFKCVPQKILIVTDLFMKERMEQHGLDGTDNDKGAKKDIVDYKSDYAFYQVASRKLSEAGFIVVECSAFTKCTDCQKVIVSKTVLNDKGFTHSGMCQPCFPYDPRDQRECSVCKKLAVRIAMTRENQREREYRYYCNGCEN